MKKLVVFDWNGTLLSDTIASWKASNVCLAYYGAPSITLARYRETFHFPIIHFYKLNGCSVDNVLARKEEAYTAYQTAYEKFAANARTRRGAREVLQWLKDNGIASIILSNYLTPKIEAELKRLKIAHFFQHISAHEDGLHILENTSKAERLTDYILKNGYHPADVLIVGDSMEEPDIGRHLGITSAGITDGYISEKRLREAGPDYIIRSLSEVIKLIKAG
ncbi:MAG: HAD family hydrolase [Alphaproteobacteria bacterium]|nr:HAD family hydrolase [Alphaproteobacteria bacterium]